MANDDSTTNPITPSAINPATDASTTGQDNTTIPASGTHVTETYHVASCPPPPSSDHSTIPVIPITTIAALHAGDERATRQYLQAVFYTAAQGALPLPEYVFGLQHLVEVFYRRARSDKDHFLPWFYLDDVLDDINASLREGQVVRPVGFADTVVFEQAWDPAQRPRMAVFKPLVEAIYGAAHAVHERWTGPVSAYSQLHERIDDYLSVASNAAIALREQGRQLQERCAAPQEGCIIIPDAKDPFYAP